MRRLLLVVMAAAVMAAAPAFAHDDYRIIGTITQSAARTIMVKQTKDGKTIAMRTDSATLVTRNQQKVAAAELKPGMSVVVDARGDSLAELVVLEVRIVPPPAKKTK